MAERRRRRVVTGRQESADVAAPVPADGPRPAPRPERSNAGPRPERSNPASRPERSNTASRPERSNPASRPRVPDEPWTGAELDPAVAERGLRGLVGGGSSQVSPVAGMRARDAARPRAEDLARAEAELQIVRRNWSPRE